MRYVDVGQEEKVEVKKGASWSDVMDLALKARTKEHAELLYEACVKAGIPRHHVRESLGYMARYYSDEEAARIFELFETVHPFFGTSKPAPEEAFRLGQEWAESIKKGKK